MPKEYSAEVTIALQVTGRLIVRAKNAEEAEAQVEEMIENGVFGFGSWQLKPETEAAGFSWDEEEEAADIQSVEEA